MSADPPTTTMPQAAAPTPSPLQIGKMFVRQYYKVLSSSPSQMHRFYQPHSTVSRGLEPATPTVSSILSDVEADDSASPGEKVRRTFFDWAGEGDDGIAAGGIVEPLCIDFERGAIDAQESVGGGILLVVTGHMSLPGGVGPRPFVHTFFLNNGAPPGRKRQFYVNNDVLRFLCNDGVNVAGGFSSGGAVGVEAPESSAMPAEAATVPAPSPTPVVEALAAASPTPVAAAQSLLEVLSSPLEPTIPPPAPDIAMAELDAAPPAELGYAAPPVEAAEEKLPEAASPIGGTTLEGLGLTAMAPPAEDLPVSPAIAMDQPEAVLAEGVAGEEDPVVAVADEEKDVAAFIEAEPPAEQSPTPSPTATAGTDGGKQSRGGGSRRNRRRNKGGGGKNSRSNSPPSSNSSSKQEEEAAAAAAAAAVGAVEDDVGAKEEPPAPKKPGSWASLVAGGSGPTKGGSTDESHSAVANQEQTRSRGGGKGGYSSSKSDGAQRGNHHNNKVQPKEDGSGRGGNRGGDRDRSQDHSGGETYQKSSNSNHDSKPQSQAPRSSGGDRDRNDRDRGGGGASKESSSTSKDDAAISAPQQAAPSSQGGSAGDRPSVPLAAQRKPEATLFIRNVPDATKESEIRALFEPFGRDTGHRILGVTLNAQRGFCFVDFDGSAAVAAVVDEAKTSLIKESRSGRKISSSFMLHGRVLDVEKKVADVRKGGGLSGGGGMGSGGGGVGRRYNRSHSPKEGGGRYGMRDRKSVV